MGCSNISKIKSPADIKSVDELKILPGNFVIKNPRAFQEEYKIGRSLGKGGFGEVRRVIHRATNDIRAVKIFKKD